MANDTNDADVRAELRELRIRVLRLERRLDSLEPETMPGTGAATGASAAPGAGVIGQVLGAMLGADEQEQPGDLLDGVGDLLQGIGFLKD